MLTNQNDRLAQVMDKMKTPKVDKISKPKPYKPYIHRGKDIDHRDYASQDRGYYRRFQTKVT